DGPTPAPRRPAWESPGHRHGPARQDRAGWPWSAVYGRPPVGPLHPHRRRPGLATGAPLAFSPWTWAWPDGPRWSPEPLAGSAWRSRAPSRPKAPAWLSQHVPRATLSEWRPRWGGSRWWPT